MATQTMAEASKLINDQIVQGVVEDIISVNPIYDMLPFTGYEGQGIIVNREETLGDAGLYGVGDTITHKNPATFAQATFSAIKIIGDVEMDGLVQASSASAGVSQLAIEISSKAKSVARIFQQGMATGDGTGNNMNGLPILTDSEQTISAGDNGGNISFELLDALLDLVKAKDGQVDFIMMTARTIRSYKALLRALGGTPAEWVVKLPSGRTTIAYEDIPIFKNEYLPTDETQGTATECCSVYAGCFDDGDRRTGLSAIYPAATPVGIQTERIGKSQTKDEEVYRIKQYTNMAIFNRRGLARLKGVLN